MPSNHTAHTSPNSRGCGPRWLLAKVPQYADLPNDIRRQIYTRCCNRAFLHWQVWLTSCTFLLIAGFATWFAIFRMHNPYLSAVAMGVWGFGGLLLPDFLKRPFVVQHFRDEISRLDSAS
jgi:hypothetical protein